MTIRATLTAAFPEARRIFDFLDRDYGDEGVAVSLDERPDGLWTVDAYFEDGGEEAVAARIRDRLGSDAFAAPLSVDRLPTTDWVRIGLEKLKPIAVGRFLIHGHHDRALAGRGRVSIEIDAGLAFGTGHHATTAGCLFVLDRLARAHRFTRPLDVGTGSGVLAIALAKLLHCRVVATDVDPVAVAVARENAARNHVGVWIRALAANGVSHSAIRSGAPYDLVVANILAQPLRLLAPRLAPLMARNGVLVLAGLLPEQRERVARAYQAQGLRLRTASTFDGWSVLVLEKPGGERVGCNSERPHAKHRAPCSRPSSKPAIRRRAPSAPPSSAPD